MQRFESAIDRLNFKITYHKAGFETGKITGIKVGNKNKERIFRNAKVTLTAMRKNFGSKPYTYPQPVFIISTYNSDGTPNAMNAAWGGISDSAELSVCISAGHKTTKNILERKAFTVSMGQADYVTECDYVGLASGNSVSDKFEKCGFHALKSEFVDAPVIAELAVAAECRLKSYNSETGILTGEIVNVSVDESVLNGEGDVDVLKVRPIAFDPFNNTYVELGKIVGKAFSDGKSIK